MILARSHSDDFQTLLSFSLILTSLLQHVAASDSIRQYLQYLLVLCSIVPGMSATTVGSGSFRLEVTVPTETDFCAARKSCNPGDHLRNPGVAALEEQRVVQ